MPPVAPLSATLAAKARAENAKTGINEVAHDTSLSTHVPASKAVTKPQGNPRAIVLDTVADQQVPTGN